MTTVGDRTRADRHGRAGTDADARARRHALARGCRRTGPTCGTARGHALGGRQTFREWLDRDNPRLAFSVARGPALASAIPESERQWAALMRAEARARLAWLVPPGTILCMSTTPFPAPRKGLPLSALEPLRGRIACLAAHGGLKGVPRVSRAGATVDGRPVGLSTVGARDSDAALVAVAKAMEIDR